MLVHRQRLELSVVTKMVEEQATATETDGTTSELRGNMMYCLAFGSLAITRDRSWQTSLHRGGRRTATTETRKTAP